MRWAVRDSFARHGQAQMGDGVQEVLGADVGTGDFTRRCRGFEQGPEGGSSSLHEVAGQGVGNAGVARVEGLWASPRLVANCPAPARAACLRPGQLQAELAAMTSGIDSDPEDEYADDEYADHDAEDREQPSTPADIPDDEPEEDVLEQRQEVPYREDDR